MQQRRVRLGDVLDDYCPRERRITNHAVVAMIDDEVRQTRCTTCDAEHEYKQARVPAPRRKKPAGALVTDMPEDVRQRPAAVAETETPAPESVDDVLPPVDDLPTESFDSIELSASESEPDGVSEPEDEWPVHRPLIRATLPRPEGQAPERKAPEFTFRPSGGRFDPKRNGGQHHGQGHRRRQAQGQPGGGPARFGNPRPPGAGQGPRHGSGPSTRPGPGHGQRHNAGGQQNPRSGSGHGAMHGNRPAPAGHRGRPSGHGRGQRQGSGPGRKRGR